MYLLIIWLPSHCTMS